MNQYTTSNTSKSNTWSLLRKADEFGYGYVAQDSQFDATAITEGWQLMFTGMYPADAIAYRDIYRNAGKVAEPTATPDLSDLLVYDFTETIEDRKGQRTQEFDLVKIMLNGVWVDATVTYYDSETVELDGHYEVSRSYAEKYMELIAKAEENAFIIEYGEYLDEQNRKWNELYTIAIRAQQTLEAA